MSKRVFRLAIALLLLGSASLGALTCARGAGPIRCRRETPCARWPTATAGTSRSARRDPFSRAPDGASWEPGSSGGGAELFDVVWNGSVFLAVGSRGTALTSPDGARLVARGFGRARRPASCRLDTATGSSRSAIGGSFSRARTDPPGPRARLDDDVSVEDVSWNGRQLVAVGEGGLVATSADGATWTRFDIPTSDHLYGVAWSGSRYVAVGGGFPDDAARLLERRWRDLAGGAAGAGKGVPSRRLDGLGVSGGRRVRRRHGERRRNRLDSPRTRGPRWT